MALRSREGFVGKRFLSLKSGEVRKFGESAGCKRFKDENWQCGVIRAATHVDCVENKDVKILVEYDDRDWQRREWIRVQSSLCLLLVETSLVWVEHKSSSRRPALTFRTVVDKVGYTAGQTRVAVEYVADRQLDFVHKTTLRDFKKSDLEESDDLTTLCIDQSSWNREVSSIRRWIESQDGQRILIETPSVLVGYRVQVYRADGTTQWYTAVIKSYNEKNQMLIVTDDTVLEEHQVNPTLTQIILLGEGVIESILNGEEPSARLCRSRRCKIDRKCDVTSSSSATGKSLTKPGRVKRASSETPRVTSPSVEAASDSSEAVLPSTGSDGCKTSQSKEEEKFDLKKSKNLNKSADEFLSDLSVSRSIVKLNRLNSVDSEESESSLKLSKQKQQHPQLKPQQLRQQPSQLKHRKELQQLRQHSPQQLKQNTSQQLKQSPQLSDYKCKYEKSKVDEKSKVEEIKGSSSSQDRNNSESETSLDHSDHKNWTDKKLSKVKQRQTSLKRESVSNNSQPLEETKFVSPRLSYSHCTKSELSAEKRCKDRKSRIFFESKSPVKKQKSTAPSSESKNIYSEFEFKGEENSLDSIEDWAPTKRLSDNKSKVKPVTDLVVTPEPPLIERAPSETDSASTEEAVLDPERTECYVEPVSVTSEPSVLAQSEILKEEKLGSPSSKYSTLCKEESSLKNRSLCKEESVLMYKSSCKEEFQVESKLDMTDKKTMSGIDINQPLTDQFIMTQRLRSTPDGLQETCGSSNSTAAVRTAHIDISKMVERAISENIEKELRNNESKIDSSCRYSLADAIKYGRTSESKDINSINANSYRNLLESNIRTMSDQNRSNPQGSVENLSAERFGIKPISQRDLTKPFSVGSLATNDEFSNNSRDIKLNDARFNYNKPILANSNLNPAVGQSSTKSLFDGGGTSKSPAESCQTSTTAQQRHPPAAHQTLKTTHNFGAYPDHLRRAVESPAVTKISGEQILGQKLPPGFPLSPPSEARTPSAPHISPAAMDPAAFQLLMQSQLQHLRQQQQQLCTAPLLAPFTPVVPLLPGVAPTMGALEWMRRYQEELIRNHFTQQLLQQSALKASLEEKSAGSSANSTSDKKRSTENGTPRNKGDVQRPNRCGSGQSDRPIVSSVSPDRGPQVQKFSHNVNGSVSLQSDNNGSITADIDQHFRESLQKAAEQAKLLNGMQSINDVRSASHGSGRNNDLMGQVVPPSFEPRASVTQIRPPTTTTNGSKIDSAGYMFGYLPYTQKFVSQSRVSEQEQKSPAKAQVRSPGPPALIKEMPTPESKLPRLESSSKSEALQKISKDIEAMKDIERIRIETVKQINLSNERNTNLSNERNISGVRQEHGRSDGLLKVESNEERTRNNLGNPLANNKSGRPADKSPNSGLNEAMFGKPFGLPKNLNMLKMDNLAALQHLGGGGIIGMPAAESTQPSNAKHPKKKSKQNGPVNNAESQLLNIPRLSSASMANTSVDQRVFGAGMIPLTIALPSDHSKILTSPSTVTSNSEHLSAPLLVNGQVINGTLPLGGSVVHSIGLLPHGLVLRPALVATSANNIKVSSLTAATATTSVPRFPLLNSATVALSAAGVPGLDGQTKFPPGFLQTLQQQAAFLQSTQHLQMQQQFQQQGELLRQQAAAGQQAQEASMHSRKRSADSASLVEESSSSKRPHDQSSTAASSTTQPKYIDSFRSFVEHAVQRAFLRDEEATAAAKAQDDSLKSQVQNRGVPVCDIAVNLSRNSSVVCLPIVSANHNSSESVNIPSTSLINDSTSKRHLKGPTEDKFVTNSITSDVKPYIMSDKTSSTSSFIPVVSNSHEFKMGTLPGGTELGPATFTQNPPSTVLRVTPEANKSSLKVTSGGRAHMTPEEKRSSPVTVRQCEGNIRGQGQGLIIERQPSPPPLLQNLSSAFTPVSVCYRQSPPDLRRRPSPPQDNGSVALPADDQQAGRTGKYHPLIRVGSAVSNDTDSDTRSASSPLSTSSSATLAAKPCEMDQPSSAAKSGHYAKFKKAWIHRYTDEDQSGSQDEAAKSKGTLAGIDGSAAKSSAQHGSTQSKDEMNKKDSDMKTNTNDKGDRKRRSDGNNDSGVNIKQTRSHSSESSSSSSTAQDNSTALRSRKKQITKKFSLETASNKSDISSSSSSHLSRDNESIERTPSINHSMDKIVKNRADFECVKKLTSRIKELKKLPTRDDLSAILASKPLNVMNDNECKSSRKPFLQSGSCVESTPRLVKCRECKVVRGKKGKNQANIFCRFYAFRQLRYSMRKIIAVSGFSAPHEADAVDMEIWMPLPPVSKSSVQISTARYILENISSRFLTIVRQELEALRMVDESQARCWKRAVQGVREMCDVCETMLFNLHWVCRKCGYAVCMDCLLVKTNRSTSTCADNNCTLCNAKKSSERWLSCTINRQSHEPESLMLVQIVPSDVLGYLVRLVEDLIPKIKSLPPTNGVHSALYPINNMREEHQAINQTHCERKESFSSLALLADAAVSQEINSINSLPNERKTDVQKQFNNKKFSNYQSLNSALTDGSKQQPIVNGFGNNSHTFYTSKTRSAVPNGCIIFNGSVDRSVSSSKAPHSWIDNGRILRLNDSQCSSNIELFQQQWLLRKPTIVSKCNLNYNLWQPEVLSRELGKTETELIDCLDNSSHTVKLKRLFDGLEKVSARLMDSGNKARVLRYSKLEGDEFRDVLPLCHQDLHNAVPLPEYTSESGSHNLVSHLPEFFVRPDLGPRLLIGFGLAVEAGEWSSTESRGTWNLSLEASDTCNVLTYVGHIKDDADKQKKAAIEFVNRSVTCPVTLSRLSEPNVKLGSVWHVYDPADADKIRTFLNKVSSEKGCKRDQFYDPILAKSNYLTDELRERLRLEYNVQTYTIVQCLGDAIVLPAGTPYQVCNLQSCIHVAQDFISSEHLGCTLDILNEMRHQANSTVNYEDKLQVKNVIYHAVRDSVAILDNDPSS